MSKPSCVLVCALIVSVLPASVTATGVAVQDATRLTLTIEPQLIRFSTPAADVAEWRLQIGDAQGQQIYDSGAMSGSALTWTLVDFQGQAIDSGIYSYSLSVRGAGRGRTRHGQLLVQKTGNRYQVWAMSDSQAALSGDGETILTVTAAASSPADSSTPAATEPAPPTSAARPTNLGRTSFAPVTGYISGTGTTNVMTKWQDGPGGVVGDTTVSEYAGAVTIGNGTYYGNLQIYGGAGNDLFAGMGPNIATGPAFNFGYAGGSFGRSAGFFNVRPDASAVAPNPSLRFMTGNTQRMIITNTGNVGIGIANPTTGRLQVVGSDSLSGQIQVGLSQSLVGAERRIISFGDDGCFPAPFECVYVGEEGVDDHLVLHGSGGVFVKANRLVPETDDLTDLGDSVHRWNAVYAANGTIQTSDARMKKEINALRYGLREVMQLSPVTFEWKNNTSDTRRHLGLLAQEVEPLMPEVIHRDANPGAPLGMNYSDLVPVLIKAIQEQHTVVDSARGELRALKIENAALRQQLQQQDDRLKHLEAARKIDVKKRE